MKLESAIIGAVTALATIGITGGCQSSPYRDATPKTNPHPEQQGPYGTIMEETIFHLNDGRTVVCIVMDGGEETITCDWANAK